MTVGEVIKVLDKWAPETSAQPWDNIGLQIGVRSIDVTGILVALDVTRHVFDEAVDRDVNLIITHHPLIFEPMSAITDERYPGALVLKLIRSDISLYAMHTNLDAAVGGINSTFCNAVGLINTRPFSEEGEGRLAFIGDLPQPITFGDLLEKVQNKFGSAALTYRGDVKRTVERVAVCGGSGGNFIEDAINLGADALLTADLKHSQWLSAEERIAVVDAGHFETESAGLDAVIERLKEGLDLGNINVSRAQNETNPVTLYAV